MTNIDIPWQAVALDSDGHPWYPFLPGPDAPLEQVMFTPELKLPTAGSCWARDLEPEEDRPRVQLDQVHLAELLYCSDVDPDQITPDRLAEWLARRLAACRCDARILDGWVADDYTLDGARSEIPTRRMQACLKLAAELLPDRPPAGVQPA